MSGIGKTFMGGSTHAGNVSMLTPEQQSAFSQISGQGGGLAADTFQNFLGGQSPEDMQAMFQKSYVDPAMMAFQQQIMPAIQENFAGANAGSSSALNQALSQSASDLSTSMGSQFGQFQDAQQTKMLQSLQLLQPYLTGHTFSPMIDKNEGLMQSLIGAGSKMGAAGISSGMMMSSKKVKENIEDYKVGIEEIRKMDVKKYDYIKEVGGQKDKIGLIAEDLPKEVTSMKDEVLHVDLYGVIGLLINAMKDLDKRMKKLEGKK